MAHDFFKHQQKQISDFLATHWFQTVWPLVLITLLIWVIFLLLAIILPIFLRDSVKGESLGTFGDFFGALTCLYTGLSLAAVVATLKLQADTLKTQQTDLKETQHQATKTHIMDLIGRLTETKQKLHVSLNSSILHDNEVTVYLLQKTTELLRDFAYYADESNPSDAIMRSFLEYQNELKKFISIQAQAYYILRQIYESPLLSDEERTALTSYLIFNCTPEDKQLLNVIFLQYETSENLEFYSNLFNDALCKNQLLLAIKDFHAVPESARQQGVCFFMQSMKAGHACECSERIMVNGKPETIIKQELRDYRL